MELLERQAAPKCKIVGQVPVVAKRQLSEMPDTASGLFCAALICRRYESEAASGSFAIKARCSPANGPEEPAPQGQNINSPEPALSEVEGA